MGETAHGVAESRFSLVRQVDEFVKVYEQLVGKPSLVAAW